MKEYSLNTEMSFGKFKGKTLREVLSTEPSYIDWCAKTVGDFYMADQTILDAQEEFPKFTLSAEARGKLSRKDASRSTRNVDIQDDWDMDIDYHNSPSYDKYGGAHGYDDDTIDSAFEGDPDNYWNID